MLARNPLTRGGRGFRGKFPSRKLRRSVVAESLAECDAILVFEFSPGVVSYREQPTLIQYADGNCIRNYYPDFEVVLVTGELIHVEVKTAKQLAKPVNQKKYRAIAADYARRGHGFRILTDKDIRHGIFYDNLKLLASCLHVKPGDTSPTEWRRQFGHAAVGFSEVEGLLGRAEVLRLIAWGIAHGDLRFPLAGSMKVQLIDQGGCDATYLL